MCLALDLSGRLPMPKEGVGWKVVFRRMDGSLRPAARGLDVTYPEWSNDWFFDPYANGEIRRECRWAWEPKSSGEYSSGIHVFLLQKDAIEYLMAIRLRDVVTLVRLEWSEPIAWGPQPSWWTHESLSWPRSVVVVKAVRRIIVEPEPYFL